MAQAKVAVSHATEDTPAIGGVFDGLSFFLVQRLPSRTTFVQNIEANGGRIVKHETQADHIIADHLRSDAPVGSLSYTFIETAVKDGELPDSAEHSAGPAQATVRVPGAAIPSRTTRTPFTAEDDRQLWHWVEKGRKQGSMPKGNVIYQQLEKINPRHTYQAWRDRYIKKLMDNPLPGAEITVPANAPPSPPTAQDSQERVSAEPVAGPSGRTKTVEFVGALEEPEQSKTNRSPSESDNPHEFTEEEQESLLTLALDIIRIDPSREEDAWERWAGEFPAHSPKTWRTFWLDVVRPIYLKRQGKGIADESGDGKPGPPSLTQQFRAARQKRSRDTEKPRTSPKRLRLQVESIEPREEPKEAEAPAAKTLGEEIRELGPSQSVPFSTQIIEIGSTDDDSQETTTSAIQQSFQSIRVVSRVSVPVSDRAAEDEILEQPDEAVMTAEEDVFEDSPDPPELLLTLPVDDNSANAEGDEEIQEAERKENLLTEANLANQQALHRAPIVRGTDLPEDNNESDDDARQDEYRQMLEEAAKSAAQTQNLPAEDNALESSLEHDQPQFSYQTLQSMSLQMESLADDPIDEFMSSQQEIDDVFATNINWPESPKASQKEPASLPSQFETQIPYPELPREQLTLPAADQKSMLPSQTAVQSEVSYPSLVDSSNSAILSKPAVLDGIEEHAAEREARRAEVEVEVDDEDEEASVDSASVPSVEDEIDLSVPEPEGGWKNSSPAKSESSQFDETVARQSARTTPFQDAMEDQEAHASESEPEVYHEISSDTSSSSLSSSEAGDSISDARSRTIPGRAALETQDILNAETQQPDFDVPLPSDSEDEERDDRDTSSGRNWSKFEDNLLLRGIQSGLKSTQILKMFNINRSPSALRNRRAFLLKQNPDLATSRHNSTSTSSSSASSSQNDLPSNPLDIPAPSPPPHHQPQPPTTEQQSPSDDGGDAYEAYLTRKTLVEGYTTAAVNEALRRTSMRDDLADLVLLEAKAGRGLPTDIPGIWTEEEDRMCESGDARVLRKLTDKHGWDGYEARLAFLLEMRE